MGNENIHITIPAVHPVMTLCMYPFQPCMDVLGWNKVSTSPGAMPCPCKMIHITKHVPNGR